MPNQFTVLGRSGDLWIDSNVGRLIMAYPIVAGLEGYFNVTFIGHFDVDRYYLLNFVPIDQAVSQSTL